MKKLLLFLIAIVAILLSTSSGFAQSNVLSAEEKYVFAQMDARLLGNWEGHGGGDGMRYDREAILCMADACAQVKNRFPSDKSQWRDSAHFGHCYTAHLARIVQSGFRKLSDPPPVSVLTCELIAYSAKRLRPQAAIQSASEPVVVHAKTRGLTREESDALLAQLDHVASGIAMPHFIKPQRQRVGNGLELVYANEREVALYVNAGGQFYGLSGTWVAKKYETGWDSTFLNPRNEYRDFIGACFKDGRVTLDQQRMLTRAASRLDNPNDSDFVQRCTSEGGEFRFALQAGQIIRLSAKESGQKLQNEGEEPVAVSAAAVEEELSKSAPVVQAPQTEQPPSSLPAQVETQGIPAKPRHGPWYAGLINPWIVLIGACIAIWAMVAHGKSQKPSVRYDPAIRAVFGTPEKDPFPTTASGLDYGRPLSEWRPRPRAHVKSIEPIRYGPADEAPDPGSEEAESPLETDKQDDRKPADECRDPMKKDPEDDTG